MTRNIGRLLALLGAVLLTFGLVGSVAAHHLGGDHPTESAEVDVAYGEFGHVTTDSELGDRPEGGDGATPGDPLETLASNLAPGHTRVDEGPITGTAPSGYTYFGQEVHITSPARTPEFAVVIQFLIDSSLLTGVDRNGVHAFRDGVLVGACTRDETDPDPCLRTRTLQYGDDLVLTLGSSQPSAAWNIGLVPAAASNTPAVANTAPAVANPAPAVANPAPPLPNTAADPRDAVPVLPGTGVVAVLSAAALAARPVLRSGAGPAIRDSRGLTAMS